MDGAKKRRIIIAFLETKSPEFPIALDEASFQAIGEGLDWLEKNANEFFEMDTIEQDPARLSALYAALDFGTVMSIGSPPKFCGFDMSKMTKHLRAFLFERECAALPGCDYYERQTTPVVNAALIDLITASQANFRSIIKEFLPKLNITDPQLVQAAITVWSKKVEALAEGSPEQLLAKRQLNALEDINKINQLIALQIPQDDGSQLTYCTLAESVGGVTAKVSLISSAKVFKQLQNFLDAKVSTLDAYSEHRADYKLSTEAILKLPKHGEVLEVQREALALNISRMLGLTTSKSTMVEYDHAPALFVPFDSIHLLQEVSQGKLMQARLLSNAEYLHYSTLKPVGEGLQSEQIIEDFGRSLGFIYLCSDTDTIGGYCQNKAIKGNELFIFDQVLMDRDKLGLDSRLSLQPIEFLLMHTRHGQGRNRTLIEDSSIETKFDSLMQLRRELPKLRYYCSRTFDIHSEKQRELEKILETATGAERKEIKEKIKIVERLKEDVLLLQAKIEERIKKIDEIIPARYQEIDPKVIKKMFVLEKQLNKPILFYEDGRPYRNPWTDRNTQRAVDVLPILGPPKQLKFKFDKPINDDILAMLRRQLKSETPVKSDRYELIINESDLLALQETTLFPEHHPNLDRTQNYLHVSDLELIKQGYGEGLHDPIIDSVIQYLAQTSTTKIPVMNRLWHMEAMDIKLKKYIEAAKDKGFGMHVLKKFQFDVQQKLQQMMPADFNKEHLNQAFSCAYKLDQVGQFNAVVLEAVRQNKLNDPAFLGFLDACIDKADRVTDHFDARELSGDLAALAKSTQKELQSLHKDSNTTMARLFDGTEEGDDDDDMLSAVKPVKRHDKAINEEMRAAQIASMSASLSSHKDNPAPPPPDVPTPIKAL